MAIEGENKINLKISSGNSLIHHNGPFFLFYFKPTTITAILFSTASAMSHDMQIMINTRAHAWSMISRIMKPLIKSF